MKCACPKKTDGRKPHVVLSLTRWPVCRRPVQLGALLGDSSLAAFPHVTSVGGLCHFHFSPLLQKLSCVLLTVAFLFYSFNGFVVLFYGCPKYLKSSKVKSKVQFCVSNDELLLASAADDPPTARVFAVKPSASLACSSQSVTRQVCAFITVQSL